MTKELCLTPAKPEVVDAVNQVCDMTGTPRPHLIVEAAPDSPPWDAYGGLLNDGRTAIAVASHFLEFFPDIKQAYAVIAHEIGHLRAGHLTFAWANELQASIDADPVYGEGRVTWPAEYLADDFVKSVGLGEALVHALGRVARVAGSQDTFVIDTPSHPSIIRRVRRLRS